MPMRRREVIRLLSGAAAGAFAASAPAAWAEGATPRKIGWLKIQDKNHTPGQLKAFREGLSALGQVEGKSFTIETRFADGVRSRLPALTEELIQDGVSVILATSQPSIEAAWRVTKSVPIVGRMNDDPVLVGLASSLARPGGNFTGVYSLLEGMTAKRLELLHQAVPSLRRVGALLTLTHGQTRQWLADTEKAATAIGYRNSRHGRALGRCSAGGLRASCRTRPTRRPSLVSQSNPGDQRPARGRALQPIPPAGDFRCARIRRCRRLHVLWAQSRRHLRCAGPPRGPDIEGQQAGRDSHRAADDIRTRYQSEDRTRYRHHFPHVLCSSAPTSWSNSSAGHATAPDQSRHQHHRAGGGARARSPCASAASRNA